MKLHGKSAEFLRLFLKRFNLGVSTYDNLAMLKRYEAEIEEIRALDVDWPRVAGLLNRSKAQLRQDLFALTANNFKLSGFFVEFGATNGVDLSNTYLLEKEFQWSGILAEPAKIWHRDLKRNRSCNIEFNCVWSDSSSELSFNEVDEAELSTISKFNGNDWASEKRKNGSLYNVKTISLDDLLEKYKAPKIIDFLSIDTEGSEYEILSNANFDEYQFRVITCEHNYTPMRRKIYDLLTSKGYERKFTVLSKWDDWYVKAL